MEFEREFPIRRVRRQTRRSPSPDDRSASSLWDFLPMLLLVWFVLLLPPSDLSRAAKLDLLLLLPFLTARLARRRALHVNRALRFDFDEFRSDAHSDSGSSADDATVAEESAGALGVDWSLLDSICAPYACNSEASVYAKSLSDADDLFGAPSDTEEEEDVDCDSSEWTDSSDELEAESELVMSKVVNSESKCGAYWALDGKGARTGVFKPFDEECPRADGAGFVPVGDESTLRAGVRVGDAWRKEIAAYRLDHDHLAGVPHTRAHSARVGSARSLKYGSLQAFARNDGAADDFGSSRFEGRDVRAIALLDMRMYNLDRHGGNMLAVRNATGADSSISLVPIDHGLSLPDYDRLGEAVFDWMDLEQTKVPLSAPLREYVAALSPSHDAAILRSLGLREESILTNTLCTEVVKRCVEEGMNLHDIGALISREMVSNVPAHIEQWVTAAGAHINAACVSERRMFVRRFCTEVDKFLAARH